MSHEVREAVDRGGGSDQRARALLVEPLQPAGDRSRGDEERPRSLLVVPAAGRLELQDGQALGRRIVGAVRGRESHHPGILDA
jgi:hypothetical protein